jgi:hypothetical protein
LQGVEGKKNWTALKSRRVAEPLVVSFLVILLDATSHGMAERVLSEEDHPFRGKWH